MLVYVDSSALIKRVISEPGSDALIAALDEHVAADDTFVASSLAWIEISRTTRMRLDADDHDQVNEAIEVALSGVAERPMTGEVVSLARRVVPRALRSLGAIHLSTAILLEADLMITYDERLAAAAQHNGVPVAAPAEGPTVVVAIPDSDGPADG